MKNLILLGILVCSLFTGCATAIKGTKEEVKFDTQPPGADVFLSTGQQIKSGTNSFVKLPRKKKEVTYEIKKEGYETVKGTLTTSASTSGTVLAALGVPVGYGIPAAIDFWGTGAYRSYDTNAVHYVLKPLCPPGNPPLIYRFYYDLPKSK